MNFKFSNISRILFKYLSVKLVFGTVYLMYLVVFVDFRTQPLGHFKILVTFLYWELHIKSYNLPFGGAFGFWVLYFVLHIYQ